MSYLTRSQEILERLRLHFPLQLQVLDPATGTTLVLDRENIHAQLVIEAAAMTPDQQSLPALYAEMARAQRACEAAAAASESAYRQWKAERMTECCDDAEERGEKKPPKHEQEAFYRMHEEYQQMSSAPAHWASLASLLGDVKFAFKIKADIMNSMQRNVDGWDSTHRAEDKQEEMTVERMEELARSVIGGGEALSPEAAGVHGNVSGVLYDADSDEEEEEEDTEEEEYEEEDETEEEEDDSEEEDDDEYDFGDEEEEEEEDDDPPPPPPKKKRSARKRMPAKKKPTKKKSTKKASRRSPRKAKK